MIAAKFQGSEAFWEHNRFFSGLDWIPRDKSRDWLGMRDTGLRDRHIKMGHDSIWRQGRLDGQGRPAAARPWEYWNYGVRDM